MSVQFSGKNYPVKTLSQAVTIVTSGDTKKVFAVDANEDGTGYITLKDGSVFKVE
jgi:hypothetical protein